MKLNIFSFTYNRWKDMKMRTIFELPWIMTVMMFSMMVMMIILVMAIMRIWWWRRKRWCRPGLRGHPPLGASIIDDLVITGSTLAEAVVFKGQVLVPHQAGGSNPEEVDMQEHMVTQIPSSARQRAQERRDEEQGKAEAADSASNLPLALKTYLEGGVARNYGNQTSM